MSLLYVDGFDTYGTTNGAAPTTNSVENKFIITYGAGLKVQAGRTGHCLEFTSGATRLRKVSLTTNATLVVGFGFYHTNFTLDSYPLYLFTGATAGVNLCVKTDGKIAVNRATILLGTSANAAITVNTWHYVELKVLCDNAGSYEVWVDGVSVVSGNGDTQVGTDAYHDGLQLRTDASAYSSARFDDLYILDGAGSTNNSNLGPVEVSTLYPNGDDVTDWTAQGGSSHYVEVDDVIFDADSTYIESDTPTDQDIFDYEGLASNGTIKGVQVAADCRETDAESFQLKTLAKSTGNTVNNATQFVGHIAYVTTTTVFEEDPDGAAWSQSTVNSTKFGVEVV